MPNALGDKYKRAEKELVWQWLFPAKTLTRVPTTGETRRYHLYETHVQRAIKRAVQCSQIPKRVSAHSFRHSFASHLLQANYDIRTIQEQLGQSDVRTTMIYTHTGRHGQGSEKPTGFLNLRMAAFVMPNRLSRRHLNDSFWPRLCKNVK